MTSASEISIIIPVYKEQEGISRCILNARSACGTDAEIIVVDGSPDGSTLKEIADDTIVTLKSTPGRGTQMNAGAKVAAGDILLFLHADTILPAKSSELIREALAAPAVTAGAFKLSFDSSSKSLRLIAFIANLRSRIERVPYGDQAVFIRKQTFFKLGCFPQISLMEDVEFFRNIKKKRREIIILQEAVKTSPRKYGTTPFRRSFHNTLLRLLHFCGTKPETLARLYR